MRCLLALFLTAASMQVSAPARAADLQPCDEPVRFAAAWFPDPEVDHGKPAAELAKPGSSAGGGAGAGAGTGARGRATPLGHVAVETKLAVVPQTGCRGVVVRLDYGKPVLRVASEIPAGSCAYARVMNHELTHVRIHRDIARQFRALQYPWGAGAGSAAILRYAKQELDRLMRAHDLFDSPEEYARNHSLCGGEITRLMQPLALGSGPGPGPGPV